MNKSPRFIALCLIAGCALQAQDYLFPYRATAGFGSGGSFQGARVAPVGTRIYMANSYQGLVLWDASSPGNLKPMGEYRPEEGFMSVDIAAEGTMAYVIDQYDSTRLVILDFDDPTSPVEVGVLGGPNADPQLPYLSRITQSGSRCFLWQEYGEVVSVEVSNPAVPVLEGAMAIDEAMDLEVQGSLLFFAMGSRGLVIVDASNPAAMIEVASLPLGETHYATAIHLSGNRAYILTGDAIQVVDVSNPSNPMLVDTITDVYGGGDLTLVQGFIYVNQYSNVQVLDYRDPANVIDHGTGAALIDGFSDQMVLWEGYLILAGSEAGLGLVDISQPPAVTFVGSARRMVGGQGYATDGTLGMVVDGFGGLTPIDESVPDSPASGSLLDLAGFCSGVARSGNRAYVAGQYGGLHVVDVSDVYAPALVGTVETPGTPADVAVDGNRLWVADGDAGLSVFDISSPDAPSLLSTLTLGGFARRLALSPPWGYVTTDDRRVQVINLTDPSAPVVVGAFDTAGAVEALQVDAGKVYLAEGMAGAEVFEVAAPASPRRLAHLGFGAEVLGCSSFEDFLLVVLPPYRMVLVDLSDPENPIRRVDVSSDLAAGRLYETGGWMRVLSPHQLAYFDVIPNPVFQLLGSWPGHPAGYPSKLKASGNRLYVTAGQSLLVFDITDRVRPRFLSHLSPNEYAQLGDLDVVGDTVYFGYDSELRSVDFANAEFPVPVGSVPLADEAHNVRIESDWVLVGNAFGAGLAIVDISEPTAPVRLGIYRSPNVSMEAAARKGDVLFAEAFGGRIDVVDVRNPAAPTPLVSYNTGAYDFSDFAVVGDWLYAAGDGYKLVNVADPMKPGFPVERGEPSQFTSDMHALPDVLYFADSNLGLMIVDVADPVNPVTASITSAGLVDPTAIQVVDDVAYVLDQQGLHVIDVTDRTQPAPLRVIPTWLNLAAIDVEGSLAVGSSDQLFQLHVLDVADPASPQKLSTTEFDAPILDLQLVGDRVYLANSHRGVAIWDVANRTQPVELGRIDTGEANDLVVVGDYAYVADGQSGLVVVELRNPAAPALVAMQPTSDLAQRIFVQDGRAYVMMNSYALEVYDITVAESPSRIGSFTDVFSRVRAVAVQGNTVYIGAGSTVQVVDFSDPANPVEIGPSVFVGFDVQELAWEGDRLLVAAGSEFSFQEASAVVQIDYSRQDLWGQPLMTTYGWVGNTRDFAVRGDRVYVAREAYGMSVLQLHAAETSRPTMTPIRVPGGVQVSWPEGFPGFFLESSETLSDAQWNPVPGGDASGVLVPTDAGSTLFLRLRGP